MVEFQIKTISETDYKLEFKEKTRDSRILQHLFKFVINKERQMLKRKKGVDFPDIDYKNLKKWSTKQLSKNELNVVKKAFNRPVLAHYKAPLVNVYRQVLQDGIKLLDYEFSGMSFKKVRSGWIIETEIIGHYVFEKK